MTANLSTPIHRAVFALPLLAIGLVAAFGAGARGAPPAVVDARAPAVHVIVALPDGASATLPGDDSLLSTGLAAKLDCGVDAPGPRGLARMPGDITTLAGRLRCAQ